MVAVGGGAGGQSINIFPFCASSGFFVFFEMLVFPCCFHNSYFVLLSFLLFGERQFFFYCSPFVAPTDHCDVN